jgi:hypothetical protein
MLTKRIKLTKALTQNPGMRRSRIVGIKLKGKGIIFLETWKARMFFMVCRTTNNNLSTATVFPKNKNHAASK